MRFVELFAGIGGGSLGFERAGMKCVGHCENNEFARRVLKKHWPAVPLFANVENIKGDEFGEFELISGGPPCQATSIAAAIQGKRTGNTLWPEMARIVKKACPAWVVVEQPIKNKAWETKVKEDLEELGYTVSRLQLAAFQFGAPHIRWRVFIIANTLRIRCDTWNRPARPPEVKKIAWPTPPRGAWRETGARYNRMDDGFRHWVDRVRCLGNALVPQIAEYIGRCIMDTNT